jgi:hypothetical protein
LSQRFDALLDSCVALATPTPSCARRLASHMRSVILCPERGTLTNVLCTSGAQQEDWSAHYRLYSQDRVDEAALFSTVIEQVETVLPAGKPLVVMVDDTLVRKRGTHIHGVGWRRDPLGPAFQTNLVTGQRYLQFSAAWPLADGAARTLPIDVQHAPSAAKLPKNADATQLQAHREEKKQRNLNAYTLRRLHALREQLAPTRRLLLCGDGSYTNQAILRALPAATHYLGRMRKDAVLHYPPEPKAPGANGRRPSYGAQAPTPEQLRQDESQPWQSVRAHAAKATHDFRVKELNHVLWRKAGAQMHVRIIVIAPLAYRLRKGHRLLYRSPAYLLTTDLETPLEELVQSYLWRWGIEVNFREQKQLFGMGQAQVRGEAATQSQPAMVVAAYSLLWVAALQGLEQEAGLPQLRPPKWRRKKHQEAAMEVLPSTGELQRSLRYEAWAGALRPGSLYPLVHSSDPPTKWQKAANPLASTLFHVA